MTGLEQFQVDHVRPQAGRTLIVGSHIYLNKEDRRKRYPDVLGVDMQPGPGVDRVLDLEEPLPDDLGTFAHIECMSVLEHSRRPWLMAANIERLMAGTLFVAVPFIWRVHGYPDDYWRFTASGVRELFPSVKWQVQLYAGSGLTDDAHVPAVKLKEHPYMQRAEVCSFGSRA